MDSILEKIILSDSYEDLGLWNLPELSRFSNQKTLFEYQNSALRNITKVLYRYFKKCKNKTDFLYMYNAKGFKDNDYNIYKFETKNKRNSGIINKKFSFFQNHFRIYGYSYEEFISIAHFLNRACFWMATGSGKSLVIIKTIELLDYLIRLGFIPKKEIMLLLPREDLIRQFSIETDEYNRSRERRIELINLRNYEEDKQRLDFGNTIKVYFCRSGLLRNERKENILDYRSYENNGDWYVFLDEAHRGGTDESLLKNYVSVLSKNGFLFNFLQLLQKT